MPLRLSTQAANLMMDAIGNVLNSGKLRVYSGTQPATANTAITTQVKLLEFTLNADAFQNTLVGVMTGNSIPSVAALATGKATWYRLLNSTAATTYFDGSVGLTGTDVVLDAVDVTLGQVVAVILFRYTMPLHA